MSKEKKKTAFAIRETSIINYEVVDEEGEVVEDSEGNNLFDTRDEAQQVVLQVLRQAEEVEEEKELP